MKKLLILFISVLFFSSCTIYQDFHFNDDGSGHLDILFDASSLIQLSQMYSGKADSVKEDKYEDKILENLDKIYLDFKVDLIDLLPDSTKDMINDIESFRGISVVAHNHKTDSKLGLQYEFKSIEDLDRKFERLSELSSKIRGNNEFDDKEISMLYKNMDKFNKKRYSDQLKFRKGKIIIKSDNPENSESEDDNISTQEMMTAMIKTQTRLFLPGKAKKSRHHDYEIIDKNVILIEDGKIGTINGTQKDIIIRYKKGWWDIF